MNKVIVVAVCALLMTSHVVPMPVPSGTMAGDRPAGSVYPRGGTAYEAQADTLGHIFIWAAIFLIVNELPDSNNDEYRAPQRRPGSYSALALAQAPSPSQHCQVSSALDVCREC